MEGLTDAASISELPADSQSFFSLSTSCFNVTETPATYGKRGDATLGAMRGAGLRQGTLEPRERFRP
jgi:hypothetical protein